MLAEIVREISRAKGPRYVVAHMSSLQAFARKIDLSFTDPGDLSSRHLLKRLGPDGIRRHSLAYDALVRMGRLDALTNDEIREEQHRRRIEGIMGAASGLWYAGILDELRRYLDGRHQKYLDRGYEKGSARYSSVTITKALNAASVFVKFLDEQGLFAITQTQQEHVDRFLTEFPSYRSALRTFIGFLNRKRKIFHRLRVPTIKRNAGNLILSVPQIQELVERCENDPNVKRALIVMLMFFYAQPARRLVALRLDEIARHEGGRYGITFAEVEVPMSDTVNELMSRYLESRKALAAMDDPDRNPWLFPGRRIGLHLNPASVTSMLKHYGVSAKSLFATSLHLLFVNGIQHPKVLVQSFGITQATAQKYLDLTNPLVHEEVTRVFNAA